MPCFMMTTHGYAYCYLGWWKVCEYVCMYVLHGFAWMMGGGALVGTAFGLLDLTTGHGNRHGRL